VSVSTQWNFNPRASTAKVVEYDSSTREYDVSTQPYDGYQTGQNPYNWKNASAWTSSLVYPAEQQYYGGPSYVPLYGGPTLWQANAGIVNQSGQYVPTQGAAADLDIYDNSTDSWDGSNPNVAANYDSTIAGKPMFNWKTPTAWEGITDPDL
jgi:hypothetical protein